LTKTELFYKLVITDITSFYIDQYKTRLQQELYEKASDPVLLKRRFRMLSQLADYESQIYKKIYQFQSNDTDDYVQSVGQIINELNDVTDRSG